MDAIAPAGPLQVMLRSGTRPKRVTLEPGGRPVGFKQTGGETRFTVATVPIHTVVVIE